MVKWGWGYVITSYSSDDHTKVITITTLCCISEVITVATSIDP